MNGDLAAAFAGASSTNNESSIEAMMAMIDDDDCAEMWTESDAFSSTAAASSLHRGLQTMEEFMRCNICSDLMKIPVSLQPCNHTFCKICFDNYARMSATSMKRTVNCPTCRISIPTKELSHRLVPNATLEQLILTYKEQVRQPLKEALIVASTATATVMSVSQSAESSSSNNSNSQEQQLSPPSAMKGRKRTRQDYAEMDANGDDEEDDGDDYQDDDDDCVEVLQPMANTETTTVQPSRAAASNFQQDGLQCRRKKNKTAYHSIKLKQLKELCRKEGLPDNGSQAELKARHEAFVSLYNAECDSTRPRSVPDLRKAILEEERNKKAYAKRTAKDTKCMEALKKHREELGKQEAANGGGDAGVLAKSSNTAFDAKLQAKFKDMIKETKAREKKKPRRTVACDTGNSTTDTDTTVDDSKGNANSSESAECADGLAAADDNSSNNQPATPATLPARNPYRKSPRSATSRGGDSNASPPNMPLNRNNNAMATPAAARAPRLSQPGSKSSARSSSPAGAAASALKSSNANPYKGSARKRPASAPAPDPAAGRPGNDSIIGPWTCSKCTFDNYERTGSTATCKMCGMSRTLSEEPEAAATMAATAAVQQETTVSF